MEVFIKVFVEYKTQVYNFQLCKIVLWYLCGIIKVKLEGESEIIKSFQVIGVKFLLPSG